MFILQDLRFLQQCCWRFKFSAFISSIKQLDSEDEGMTILQKDCNYIQISQHHAITFLILNSCSHVYLTWCSVQLGAHVVYGTINSHTTGPRKDSILRYLNVSYTEFVMNSRNCCHKSKMLKEPFHITACWLTSIHNII